MNLNDHLKSIGDTISKIMDFEQKVAEAKEQLTRNMAFLVDVKKITVVCNADTFKHNDKTFRKGYYSLLTLADIKSDDEIFMAKKKKKICLKVGKEWVDLPKDAVLVLRSIDVGFKDTKEVIHNAGHNEELITRLAMEGKDLLIKYLYDELIIPEIATKEEILKMAEQLHEWNRDDSFPIDEVGTPTSGYDRFLFRLVNLICQYIDFDKIPLLQVLRRKISAGKEINSTKEEFIITVDDLEDVSYLFQEIPEGTVLEKLTDGLVKVFDTGEKEAFLDEVHCVPTKSDSRDQIALILGLERPDLLEKFKKD